MAREEAKGMRNAIEKELDALESDRGVKVLLAVESGSRAWGMASPDSDYDVRFVYARTVDDYLRLEDVRDTVEWRLDETLDITGWDLRKFMRLLRGSNPTAFEWLSSPLVYREDEAFTAVREVAGKCFSRKASAFHYIGMAKGEQKVIAKSEFVSAKTYLYAVRALLAARWSLDEGAPAPMLLEDLVSAKLDVAMAPVVKGLLEAKASTREKGAIGRDDSLELWIESEVEELTAKARATIAPNKVSWKELDEAFLKMVTGN